MCYRDGFSDVADTHAIREGLIFNRELEVYPYLFMGTKRVWQELILLVAHIARCK